MKVLFLPLIDLNAVLSHPVTLKGSNRIYCDYQMDCIYHGLKSLLKNDLEESILLPQWYKDVDKLKLYGNGFTIYGLLDKPEHNVGINDKIVSKYYDQIIVPIHNNMYTNSPNDNLLQVVKYLLSYKNNVKVICGNDETYVDKDVADLVPYFKRELVENYKNVYPISFCVPQEKIADMTSVTKTTIVSKMIPNFSGESGWVIQNENEYYQLYKESIFAITCRKGGWDSLRHYEIMMNGCIPLFNGIDKCPEKTLAFLDKKFLTHIYKNYMSMSLNQLMGYCHEMVEYTKDNLTTEGMAKYVLGI